MCVCVQARRVGEENDICCCEYQHMGVPVAHDRCLTEEVREGPCFPGCLLCSMPIAQRNTLREKQRKEGKGGEGGGVGKGGTGPNAYSPRPQDSGDPEEELRTTNWMSSSSHPAREPQTKGHPLPTTLIVHLQGSAAIAVGHTLSGN